MVQVLVWVINTAHQQAGEVGAMTLRAAAQTDKLLWCSQAYHALMMTAIEPAATHCHAGEAAWVQLLQHKGKSCLWQLQQPAGGIALLGGLT
jgi:phage/plasmid primase-like uncharacterized protein